MPKKSYAFKTANEKVISHLSTIENKSEYLEKILIQFVTGELDLSALTKMEMAKIKEIEANARLRNARANYIETFGREPKGKALEAIKTNTIGTTNNQTATQITKNYSVFKHVESIKYNDVGQTVVICKYCRSDFIHEINEVAIQQFKDHIEKSHTEELLK